MAKGTAQKFSPTEAGILLSSYRLNMGNTHLDTMDSGFTVGAPVGTLRGLQGECESIVSYSFGVVVTVRTGETVGRILITPSGQGEML